MKYGHPAPDLARDTGADLRVLLGHDGYCRVFIYTVEYVVQGFRRCKVGYD